MARRPVNLAVSDVIAPPSAEAEDGRRARSERTSRRVIEAARTLFLEHGYWPTTIEAIAARAGVTGQTVLNQFGTKVEVLAVVLDQAIAGDAAPLAVIERSWFTLRDGESAIDAITRFTAAGTAILARVAPIYDVVRSASSLPEIKHLLTENRRHRRADQRHLVNALAHAGHLRPGLDIDRAADIVYGVMNEDVFLLLTGDRRWSRRRFATWLADTLVHHLAATGGDPAPDGHRPG